MSEILLISIIAYLLIGYLLMVIGFVGVREQLLWPWYIFLYVVTGRMKFGRFRLRFHWPITLR